MTLVIVCLAGGAGPAWAGENQPASVQLPDGPQSAGGDRESPDYNGLDLTRPQQNAELRLQYQSSSSPSSRTDQDRAYLKLATKIQLPDDWKLGLQAQLPFVDKTTNMFNMLGAEHDSGVGDAFAQAVLARTIDAAWAYGFGVRLVAPTGQDSLGSGKLQIMPAFGVRYSFLQISADTYFVPSVRYATSFAGDQTRRNISQPQIAPTLNIALPDHWFVTFYPSNDIRINFGDAISGQTGRLFLPFDAAVGRKIGDRVTASLELGVPIIKDYPVYDLKAELRVGVQF
jgi:hypothetical protein